MVDLLNGFLGRLIVDTTVWWDSDNFWRFLEVSRSGPVTVTVILQHKSRKPALNRDHHCMQLLYPIDLGAIVVSHWNSEHFLSGRKQIRIFSLPLPVRRHAVRREPPVDPPTLLPEVSSNQKQQLHSSVIAWHILDWKNVLEAMPTEVVCGSDPCRTYSYLPLPVRRHPVQRWRMVQSILITIPRRLRVFWRKILRAMVVVVCAWCIFPSTPSGRRRLHFLTPFGKTRNLADRFTWCCVQG